MINAWGGPVNAILIGAGDVFDALTMAWAGSGVVSGDAGGYFSWGFSFGVSLFDNEAKVS